MSMQSLDIRARSATTTPPPGVREPLAGDLRVDDGDVRRLLRRLARNGTVVQVVKDLCYDAGRIDAAARLIATLALEDPRGEVTAARFRDATGLGRKRAIQLLEFFDRAGYTRRVRDAHVLRSGAAWAMPQHPARGREGTRIRWCARASNPAGGVSRLLAGSTPAAFRHGWRWRWNQERPEQATAPITPSRTPPASA